MDDAYILKTPQNTLLVAAITLVQEAKENPDGISEDRREKLIDDLHQAAIEYARHFVAEECARIIEAAWDADADSEIDFTNPVQDVVSDLVDMIRKHGGKCPSKIDLSATDRI